MKRIVSVSLGSSKRDHKASLQLLGEQVEVQRIGTDGSIDRAIDIVRRMDGTVDAFGLGGIDLYVHAGGQRFAFRDAQRIAAAAVKTPLVDGSGLKHTLERRVVDYVDRHVMPLRGRKVLMVSSVDRFGMAEALIAAGANVTHGDLMFGLGLPIPLHDMRTVGWLARAMLPTLTRLPFGWLYPTGEKQDERQAKFRNQFEAADVIAGDFHYISRHMPDQLPGRTILTNTITEADLSALHGRGISTLITTTPNLGGRSFGTNLMEGLLVAMAGQRPEEMTTADYDQWLDRLALTPRVERFTKARRSGPRTIIEVLGTKAEAHPDRMLYRFLPSGEVDDPLIQTWTYADVHRRALAIGAALAARKLERQTVLLLYPPGLEFAAGFLGALAAGAIAVPAYPPDPSDMSRTLGRLLSIVEDAGAAAVLTTEAIAGMREALAEEAPTLATLPWIATDAVDLGAAATWRPPVGDPEAVAFLQYTSGSTGAPKGVMIRHKNILHNSGVIQRGVSSDETTHVVSWLPQYHDMGLMSALVEVIFVGGCSTLMSPLDFLRRPVSWLEAISRFRGTHAGGPNFAFDLCVRKATDADVARLDLSSWRNAWNGAEPVREGTLRAFAAKFGKAGFSPEAARPCYGLAESTVGVTFLPHSAPLRTLVASRDALERGSLSLVSSETGERVIHLVGCGCPDDVEVVIADPQKLEACAPDQVGEIWVASESVGAGYWNRPVETLETFGGRLADGRGPFLRTGDLGLIHDGQLFVTGRLKDVVIVRGRNHAAQDLERTLEHAHPRVRPGCSAAFEVAGTSGRLAVVAEVTGGAEGLDDVAEALREAVLRHHQINLDELVLLEPRSVPKTSSGKVQRRECQRRLRSGELAPLLHLRQHLHAPVAHVEEKPLAPGESELIGRIQRAIGRVSNGVTVSPHEPLSRLGLDSLAVIDAKVEIERELGVTVPLPVLLKAHTLTDLARAIAEQPKLVGAAAVDPWSEYVNPPVAQVLRAFQLDKKYVRGEGCYVEDDAGRRYLDFTASYGALPFGFNPPAIWACVKEAAQAMPATMVQPSLLDAAGRLARRLVEIAPKGLNHVTFANSGTEAIEAAVKLARSATGRLGIVSMDRAFHGKTLGALSATGHADRQAIFGAPAPGFIRAPFGDLPALEALLASQGSTLAAVIVEPIQGEGGIFVAPPGYLAGVRALCDRHGVLLVFDEIQTGLGRTGTMFACERDHVVPDILALAKALGGGLVPIGAVLCNDRAYSETFALRHSSTFAGNALAALVGMRSLELLTEGDLALVRHVATEGVALGEGLAALQKRYPHLLREVRGRGFMYGLELTTDPDAFSSQCLMGAVAGREGLALALCSYLLNVEGIRLAPTLHESRVMRVEPPLVATHDDCERFLGALERALGVLDRCDTERFLGHLVGHQTPTVRKRAPRVATQPDAVRWGFVFHPLDHRSYVDFDPGLGAFSGDEVRRLVASLGELPNEDGGRAMVIGTGRIESPTGSIANGELIAIPATADELLAMPAAEALERVREAVLLARDRGASIVGLGAYSSIVTRNAEWLRDVGVPVTTGNSFTVVAALDLVMHAVRAAGVPLHEATVAVVGATGAIGRALALELAPSVGGLLLSGNPAHPQQSLVRLRHLAGEVVASLANQRPAEAPGRLSARVTAATDVAPVELVARLEREGLLAFTAHPAPDLAGAAVVVTATSSTGSLVVPEQLGKRAIVCDVSRPANVSPRVAAERSDVIVLEGGIVELPRRRDFGVRFGLESGLVYACMAETALLALERRFKDGTIGHDLSPRLIADLRALAVKHGFSCVPAGGGRSLSRG